MHKFFAKTLFLGKKVHYLPECHSTNDEASLLMNKSNESEGMLVISDYQLNGKGQRGNSWESERGKNIMVSIVLKPTFIGVNFQFYLHTICSLAIYDTLVAYLGRKVKIKWPNDIYYEDRKICGILIENSIRANRIEQSIVGIGLNVNQVNFKTDYATSLKEISLQDYDRGDLLEDLLLHFEKRYLQLKNGHNKALRRDYLTNLYKLNEQSRFRAFSQEFHGEIIDVNDKGQLLIRDFSGTQTFNFKDVVFVRN